MLCFRSLALDWDAEQAAKLLSSCVMRKIRRPRADRNRAYTIRPADFDGIFAAEKGSELLPSEGPRSAMESAIQRVSVPSRW
jgi:hypothetical protein